MTYLLDTQIILWLSGLPGKLSPAARYLIEDSRNELRFSPVSILEISIKVLKGRSDFQANPFEVTSGLTSHGIAELPVRSIHAAHVSLLQPLHKDPFDRLLLAQAIVEDLTLLTTDRMLLSYSSHVMDAR